MANFPYSSISFAGCGTLNFYQVGALSALQDSGLDSTLSYAGASAGAGLSVLAAAGVPARQITAQAAYLLAPYYRRNIIKNYKIPIEFGRAFLESFREEISVQETVQRVAISITQLKPYRNILVQRFDSVGDIFDAVRASCHLPSWRYPYVRFRGRPCIDGGVSWNNPILGDGTLRISPLWMDKRADISPSRRVNPWWGIHVPSTDWIWKLFELGRRDMNVWIAQPSPERLTGSDKRWLRRLRGRVHAL
ncbi:MAG: patatin-like phospholipase family protein [Myxococcota bacterium]